MVVLLGRRSKVLPAIGGPCRGRRIPRGADAPLGTYARTAPPEASRFLLPPARRFRSSPPRKARRRALLQTPRPAGRRAWQGRRWAAPVDARPAGRGPALPASAWPLPPVAPPERRGEAGCPGRRSRDDAPHLRGRFVPPVFSSSFSGARASSPFVGMRLIGRGLLHDQSIIYTA